MPQGKNRYPTSKRKDEKRKEDRRRRSDSSEDSMKPRARRPNDSPGRNMQRYRMYYAPKCDYSLELFELLKLVPVLATAIRCVDMTDPQMKKKYNGSRISHTPAIDDPALDEPQVATAAFQWVAKKSLRLYKKQIISIDTLDRIQDKILELNENLLQRHRETHGVIGKGYMRRCKTVSNPRDDFKGYSDAAPLTRVVSAKAVKRLSERFDELKKRRAELGPSASPEGFTDVDRSRMFEEAKMHWMKQGSIDPETGHPKAREPIKRDSLRVRSMYTVDDIKKYEADRDRMFAMSAADASTLEIRQPIKRTKEFLGSIYT